MIQKCFYSLAIYLLAIHPLQVVAQNDTLATLFRNSYATFELMRNDLGIYRDSKLFQGTDFHPASVASIGMGLMAECIATEMEWITDGEDRILATLRAMTGATEGFKPDRNETGYFKHWINMETGVCEWNSEYSTIDSGILTAGALFASKYFCDNDSIRRYAQLLWESIDWSKAIQNPDTGGIFLSIEKNGAGTPNFVTLPFNEYMLVAWLAMKQEGNTPGRATELWAKHYADPNLLPTKDYGGIPLLTDNPARFLSSFVIQFPYYLCSYFNQHEGYLQYFKNAQRADSLWWTTVENAKPYQWGLGAGASILASGYHPDAINNNDSLTYSPHIIGGFIPVYQEGASDLLLLYEDGESIYQLPNVNQDEILWRKSLVRPDWVGSEVQGVDYSTMLFGLASLPEFLGKAFFEKNTQFFEGPCSIISSSVDPESKTELRIFPNPTASEINFHIQNGYVGQLEIQIWDNNGRQVLQQPSEKLDVNFESHLQLPKLSQGIYFLEITGQNLLLIEPFVLQE